MEAGLMAVSAKSKNHVSRAVCRPSATCSDGPLKRFINPGSTLLVPDLEKYISGRAITRPIYPNSGRLLGDSDHPGGWAEALKRPFKTPRNSGAPQSLQ